MDELNIIASGCGTGKSYLVGNKLLEYYPEIKPIEILFITSRSIIVDQQSKSRNINKYELNNQHLIDKLNGVEDSILYLKNKGITIMTYDKIIDILINKNNERYKTLQGIKIVILDECHTLFSDTFMKNIEVVKVWIRDTIYLKEKIFLGLTATPNILYYFQSRWGVKINKLNNDVFIKYRAKQLHCTNLETLPYIIATNKLKGKTIIMCGSITECFNLQDQLPNAAVLVSKSSPHYTKDMDNIRKSIVDNKKPPCTFNYPIKRNLDGDGIEFEERKLEILITTSTLREGINISEESGIRNVVSCYQDELHIIQFMGRCRYNIDNLVVVDTYNRYNNLSDNEYLNICKNDFKEYMISKSNTKWFDDISYIVEHDCYDTKRFILGTDEKKFIKYINNRWLVPIGIDDKELDLYKIWRQEDKEAIVEMAIKCKIYSLCKSQITFNKVINTLIETLGYEIITDRYTVNKQKHTYKLIISFDEDKLIFVKPYKGIND